MIKISASVCVDAPVSKVWAVLAKLDSIHVWNESIHESYCESDQIGGLDAVRVCKLGSNVTVKETIIAWDEGQSYTYLGQGVPLVKRAANTWRVEAHGRQTLVTSSAEVVVKGGIFGHLLEPLLLFASVQLGRRSLATFKYFVEHDKPYVGDARRLLPIPAIC